MAKTGSPRKGSLQFWPRKRAKKLTPRISSWTNSGNKPLAFMGYKVGMTHLIFKDDRKHSITQKEFNLVFY